MELAGKGRTSTIAKVDKVEKGYHSVQTGLTLWEELCGRIKVRRRCGGGLKITEDGRNFEGYSPFTAGRYFVNLYGSAPVLR